jgi:WD40 repeat protein
LRVFISYARKDAADLAQQLLRRLAKAGLEPWLDTARIGGGAVWTKDIEQAIDGCDVAIALLSPGSYQSDICRAEQLRALRKGKRVIPILGKVGTDIPIHLETKNYRDPGELDVILQDIQNGENGVTLRTEFQQTYVTAPPLPRNYIERPEEIERLRQVLIADEPGPSIAVTALKGMGGIGKTVLAQALAHDEAVRDAFPDGIAWCTVGKESTADFVDRMREVRRALGEEPGDKETQLECVNRYRTLMAQKAALVIVDDVWRTEDIEPFIAESPRSRLLFTTRDGSIARAVGADEQGLNVLGTGKARELLARWAGMPVAALRNSTDEVIRECGGLPLALSMIGALLRGKPPSYWPHVLGLLRQTSLDKISAPAGYAHRTLMRAIQVSVEALDQRARERYLSLAVLLEDMAVHPAIQQVLWNADELDWLETAEQFVGLSLAQREEGGSIRLHDLQLDYIRAQYADREALELIRGAVRLSLNVIAWDAGQFVSQLVGRLMAYEDQPAIRRFTSSLAKAAHKAWLRPLHPALHPPGTALLRTLEGHPDEVYGVAISLDGQRAVSASEDETLKVWDLKTGRQLRTLEGHSSSVNGVALSADGRRVVSASSDKTLKVWDLETGRELLTLKGHSDWVNGVALNTDGRRAVSASSDKTLKVWDLETGRELCTLEGHSSRVNGVAVCPDGRRAVSASRDNTLKLWDLETSRELRTLKGHSDWVNGVALSTDGRRAVSASSDETLKVWDLETGLELHTLKGHSSSVRDVAVSPDGRRAVSASEDETLKVWDVQTGKELWTLQGHASWVRAVAVSADGRLAVSASYDDTLKVWDLERARELRTLKSHSAAVTGVAVTADRRRAVSCSLDRMLKVWDLEIGRQPRTFEGHSEGVTAVAVSADGRHAVSASNDHTLKVWDLETGRELRTLLGHSSFVYAVAVSPDGQRAITASSDNMLGVWDLKTGRKLRTIQGHSNSVSGVAISPDGRLVVSASYDSTLKMWDFETGSQLGMLEGHSDFVRGVAVSADGRRAVSASDDKTLKLWDLETCLQLRTLQTHSRGLNCVALSPDGRRAVSASWDKTLNVWDLEVGEALATFTADAALNCCAFAGTQTVLAGDEGGHVHFLKLELAETTVDPRIS